MAGPRIHDHHAPHPCAYARELGHTLRLRLVEDRPGEPLRPWRERMPHGEDPLDTHAMGAIWRLQQQLHQLRYATGRSTENLAASLGLRPLDCWQLENSPRAPDAALINVMLYARFFSCRIVFQLTPLDNGEVTGMGKVVRDDGETVYDGNTETGDDEQHAEGE